MTTTPFVAATRKNAIDSLFTYLTICATSPYGVGDGALGYAGFVFAKIAPSCAPGACNVGRCGPGGTTRSQEVSKCAPARRAVASSPVSMPTMCCSIRATELERSCAPNAAARRARHSSPRIRPAVVAGQSFATARISPLTLGGVETKINLPSPRAFATVVASSHHFAPCTVNVASMMAIGTVRKSATHASLAASALAASTSSSAP